MKILIFENEFVYLDTTFRYVNKLYFDGKLEYEVFASSQDFGALINANKYDLIIIDISLAKRSDLDGYGLLKKLNEIDFGKDKIVIMTGNHQIKEGLKDKGLDFDYKILTKPIDINDLISVLNSVTI
tara:strand:+ start:151 stop:531 length:381 start_codon:yes stop_codon:yes gene_type:complete